VRGGDFCVGNGSSVLGLCQRVSLAEDAGVAADGEGFVTFTLSYLVGSEERVEVVLAEAERACGRTAKPAQCASSGGRLGYARTLTAACGRWRRALARGHASPSSRSCAGECDLVTKVPSRRVLS
jgi:hypothetical protein